jgi:replication factor A1
MGDVSLLAVVVDPGEIREFVRKDGGKGQVRGVLLGDETGKIRLTLWNEQAAMLLEKGETIEVMNGSCRERYGSLEIQTGNYSAVRKSSEKVSFSEKMTPIAELKPGMLCSVSGFVTGLGEVREFQRDDGKAGRVANIYISDETGRIKVALWAEHVDLLRGLDLGYKAELIDALAKSGWNEELELSCGWRTRITFAPPG